MDEVVDWFSNLTSASLYDQRSDGCRKWCFVGKLMQQYGYELFTENSQNSIRLESMLLHLLVNFDLDMASAAYVEIAGGKESCFSWFFSSIVLPYIHNQVYPVQVVYLLGTILARQPHLLSHSVAVCRSSAIEPKVKLLMAMPGHNFKSAHTGFKPSSAAKSGKVTNLSYFTCS